MTPTQAADRSRRALGLLTGEETAALAQGGVLIPDPFSVLVSRGTQIGRGTILWPGSSLQITGEASLWVGEEAQIGAEGGFSISANGPTRIGSKARLLGGGSLSGTSEIGEGAQILGAIRARDCQLAGGLCYKDAGPDRRGAVLKGNGDARGIRLEQGQVIQAFGLFSEAPVRMQSFFHPGETSGR